MWLTAQWHYWIQSEAWFPCIAQDGPAVGKIEGGGASIRRTVQLEKPFYEAINGKQVTVLSFDTAAQLKIRKEREMGWKEKNER